MYVFKYDLLRSHTGIQRCGSGVSCLSQHYSHSLSWQRNRQMKCRDTCLVLPVLQSRGHNCTMLTGLFFVHEHMDCKGDFFCARIQNAEAIHQSSGRSLWCLVSAFAQVSLPPFPWQNTPKIMQWQHSIAFHSISSIFWGVEMVLPWFTWCSTVVCIVFPIHITGPFVLQVPPPCDCHFHWFLGHVANPFPWLVAQDRWHTEPAAHAAVLGRHGAVHEQRTVLHPNDII